MQPRPRPHHDVLAFGSQLEPGAAWRGPDGPLQVLNSVRLELLNCLPLGLYRLDVLLLDLFNHQRRVPGERLHGRDDGAVAVGAEGADDGEVVGEVGHHDGQVALGRVLPLVLQVDVAGAVDGEAGNIGDVEAGAADENVELVQLSVLGDDTLLRHLADSAEGDFGLVAGQALHVAVVGDWSLFFWFC